jgi:glutamate-ammonia-ligase adenylyltransferase
MERAAALCYRPRPPESVWPRLAELRGRMEEERASEKNDAMDLKLGPGGMADVEFLVQGVQLLYGHEKEDLRRGNVREALPEAARRALENEEAAQKLTAAFHVLRALEHRLHLMTHLGGGRISRVQFQNLVRLGLWPPPQLPLRVETWEDLLALRRFVRRQWEAVCQK